MKEKNKKLLESLGIFADIDLKNITRVGSSRTRDGWWLRISRDGETISRVFSDDDFGNPFLSLQAAVKLREKFKPKKTTSNTGYMSLFISVYSKKSPMLRVSYKNEAKAFNIMDYGYIFALKEGMQWLNNKDETLYNKKIKLNIDKGLTYLNKNMDQKKYLRLLEKTFLYKKSDGDYYVPKNRRRTLLILANQHSQVIRKDISFTYSEYVKNTLKYVRKAGFDFQVENDNFKYDKDDYYAVVLAEHNTSSKEFCFRVRKLVDFSKKEFYTIKKSASFFKTIYKDNPTVKKDIINIIPDFQTKEEFDKYLHDEKVKKIAEKKELLRKKNANKSNVEYAKRKDKQIGYISKIIHDYDRLINWLSNEH
ncbi:hypothetical protein [Sulfurimonas indica]|uniref:hypothetical protein n=1 Tax=Sulfurimonas TaxID=202746 RepID=UPI001264073F|nr:hypothetical protein [Sulfurimonas indica]